MRKQIVYFLKGLPASGKSTWAQQKIEEDRYKGIVTKRINKDELRAMLDNSVFSKEREEFILKARDSLISFALAKGYNVIIDDTNFNPKHLERIKEIIKNIEYNLRDANIELVEKFFDTPLYECVERDRQREKSVGRNIILDMYNRYIRNTKQEEAKFNPELPDCLIVDVDGTLALHENRRSPFEYWKAGEDRLNAPIERLLHHIQYSLGVEGNIYTIIMTGRENLCDEDGWTISDLTQSWLHKYGINFTDIFIRKEGDHRSDWMVKKELYEEHIKGKYNVIYVIEDRKQVIDMWREQGLTVLDVAGSEF